MYGPPCHPHRTLPCLAVWRLCLVQHKQSFESYFVFLLPYLLSESHKYRHQQIIAAYFRVSAAMAVLWWQVPNLSVMQSVTLLTPAV